MPENRQSGSGSGRACDVRQESIARKGPRGHYVTEPIWYEETIIFAELDMTLPAACKMEHDAVGHYARPDVLELIVKDTIHE